jgi:hypothetical protein
MQLLRDELLNELIEYLSQFKYKENSGVGGGEGRVKSAGCRSYPDGEQKMQPGKECFLFVNIDVSCGYF